MDKRLGLVGVLCVIAVALSACGDSEDGGAPQPPDGGSVPVPPVANAGTDRSVWKGDLVTLDGRASHDPEGDPLTFEWRQTEGPAVPLSDDRVPQPTFAAPRATAVLRFTLEVSDGQRTSAPDEVLVLVRNRAPYAVAGADQVAVLGHVVTLDASASGDPDGDPITATWFQRSGPPVTLVANSAASATFVAPTAPAVLEFGVVVSDGEVTSREDALRVQVVDEAANWPPMANAGADRDVARRSVVVLTGSALDRESDPLTWTWTQVGGPSVALLGADGPSPSFVAPAEDADLEFQLVVADALSTGSDRVTIRVRNQAPAITSLSLSPGSPVTTDPLVASATASDVDGDAVTLTWEWRRNGAVLAETGPSLPASLTTRDDVFVVRVTANDGSLQTSAERSVTILDSPPILTLDAPATVTWGEAAGFTATASDPDGDPVGDLVLLHGPAGMTVTAAGVGAWTATLPMFDRTLDVRFALGVHGSSTLLTEGTIRVEDPHRSYPLRRSGMEIPILQDGLVAVDADGDGTEELLVASRSGLYELARAGSGYAQRWVYPFAADVAALASLEARDVDGDGKPEIFFSTYTSYAPSPGTLVKLDGAARREAQRTALACADLEIADLEGDGALELVCLQAGTSYGALQQAVVLDAATLATRWQTASIALGEGLAVGNVDADAALEIVTSGGYVFDGATAANEWAYGQAFGATVDTGDLDDDGIEEIVGMDGWSRFRGFSAVWKTPVWEKTTFDNDALLVADADADGVPEILIGDGQWGNVTAWRYRPATNDLEPVFQIDSQEHGVTSLAVADLDGDGALELAWGSGATSSGADVFVVAGRNPQIGIEWATDVQISGPFVGAEPARTETGGAPALLFEVPETNSGYDGARLVRLDPVTGAVTTSAEIGSNWSSNAAIDVADYDGDGVDEIFVATANLYDGYAVAWDFAAGAAEWTSPADFDDGRAMTHADLNGDGAPELVGVNASGFVQVYDVPNARLLWKSTALSGYGVDVEVADVDRDGTLEIVALSSSRLVLFRAAASGPVPWVESASVAVEGMDLAIADGDGDGAPELYVLVGTYAGSSVWRFDGALTALGSFAVRGTALSLFVEDLGFPRKNLVLGKGDSWSYGGVPGTLEAVDATTGAQIWQSPPLWGYVPRNSLGYVDLDGDGLREIAFGTSSGMHLTR
jgi:hypothetical protein